MGRFHWENGNFAGKIMSSLSYCLATYIGMQKAPGENGKETEPAREKQWDKAKTFL